MGAIHNVGDVLRARALLVDNRPGTAREQISKWPGTDLSCCGKRPQTVQKLLGPVLVDNLRRGI
eukprot:9842039-Lingulodinium_polyedra.AAC.1